jgi:DNA-binding transcriptional ArsR family regulator
MVAYSVRETAHTDDEVDRIFRALADSTRRDIVRRTLVGPVNVSALAQDYAMSFAAVQKHVSVREKAGLVDKEHHGRERRVRARAETIQKVRALLDEYARIWTARIDRLDAMFEEEDKQERGPDPI